MTHETGSQPSTAAGDDGPTLSFSGDPMPLDGIEGCIACGQPFKPGELVLSDASGGFIHSSCAGPERESYTGVDGEPLKDGEPIPTGSPWPANALDKAVTQEGVAELWLRKIATAGFNEGIASESGMDGSEAEKAVTEALIQEGIAVLAPKPTGTEAKGGRLIPAEMTAAMQERIAFNLCDEFGADFVAANQRFAKAVYAEAYSAGRPTGTEAGRGVDAEADLAASVAETVKETGGWWKSCTGCHETNEGHETGHYSYSRIFRCHVGSGCSECGGLGVRWEHDTEADFAAMAAEFATTPPVSPSPDSTGHYPSARAALAPREPLGTSGAPILTATIQVYAGERTSNRLTFAAGTLFPEAERAVERAIAAIRSEYAERQACPARPRSAPSEPAEADTVLDTARGSRPDDRGAR